MLNHASNRCDAASFGIVASAVNFVVLVDMQNAFASKGGMFDLAGFDISGASRAIEVDRELVDVARQAGVRVIYLQMTFKRDLSDAGERSPLTARSWRSS